MKYHKVATLEKLLQYVYVDTDWDDIGFRTTKTNKLWKDIASIEHNKWVHGSTNEVFRRIYICGNQWM